MVSVVEIRMYRLRKILIRLLLSAVFLAFLQTDGEAWEDTFDGQPEAAANNQGAGFNPGSWAASFYKNHISPVDGSRCPSMPSCSSYSVQAFKRHGFFIGWVMTVDRLLHEGDESRVSPLVYVDGEWKIFDPIENNDFWWFHANGKRQ